MGSGADEVELPEVDDAEILRHIVPAIAADPDHVSLPSGSDSDVNVELPGDGECCSMACLANIAQDPVLQAKMQEIEVGLAEANPHDRDKLQYDCMRLWQRAESGWRRFSAWGREPVCKSALQRILGLGNTKYPKFCKALAEGFKDPPQDMRRTQHQKSLSKTATEAITAANTLLSWVYENMAEHLAESDSFVKAKKSLASARGAPTSFVWQNAQGPTVVKWLPPGTTLSELKEYSVVFNPDVTATSFSTFSRVYHTQWQDWLKIRAEGQHSKCNDCAKLKAWRRQCISKEDCDLVQKQLQEHIASMKEDRRVDGVINSQAQQSAKGEVADPDKTVLSLTIDGMDSAKFKIPRRLEATKAFQGLWRPECRFIGCLAEGISENFFIGDCDLVKDSNLDLTLISHVVHEAQAELERRGVAMPAVLRLHSDNASAELKNQVCFKYCAWLIHRHLFKEIVVSMFRVGHSHGKIDQRFSECRSILVDTPNLETPASFLEALKKVKAREGRALNLEEIHASLNFSQFFSELDVQVSGHTQTKKKSEQGEEAVHVFTFQSRSNLPVNAPAVEETFPQHAPHPDDVILSCKHYLCSHEDSQLPQVIAPHEMLAKFDPEGKGPRHICGRRSFSEQQAKKFNTTALSVGQPPWNMHDASAYLLRLVTLNQEGCSDQWQPPCMTWTLQGARSSHPDPPKVNAVSQQDLAWANRAPARVTVTATAAKSKPEKGKGKKGASDAGQASKGHGKSKSMKRPAASRLDNENVSLPSAEESEEPGFVPAAPVHPTGSSAGLGAPHHAVVEPPAPAKRRALGWLPMPEGARDKISTLQHSKCRAKGCPDCRKKIGLVLNHDQSAWVWSSETS